MRLHVRIQCPSFLSVLKEVKSHLRSLNQYDRSSPVYKKISLLQCAWGFEETQGFTEPWRIAWEWGVGGDILFYIKCKHSLIKKGAFGRNAVLIHHLWLSFGQLSWTGRLPFRSRQFSWLLCVSEVFPWEWEQYPTACGGNSINQLRCATKRLKSHWRYCLLSVDFFFFSFLDEGRIHDAFY